VMINVSSGDLITPKCDIMDYDLARGAALICRCLACHTLCEYNLDCFTYWHCWRPPEINAWSTALWDRLPRVSCPLLDSEGKALARYSVGESSVFSPTICLSRAALAPYLLDFRKVRVDYQSPIVGLEYSDIKRIVTERNLNWFKEQHQIGSHGQYTCDCARRIFDNLSFWDAGLTASLKAHPCLRTLNVEEPPGWLLDLNYRVLPIQKPFSVVPFLDQPITFQQATKLLTRRGLDYPPPAWLLDFFSDADLTDFDLYWAPFPDYDVVVSICEIHYSCSQFSYSWVSEYDWLISALMARRKELMRIWFEDPRDLNYACIRHHSEDLCSAVFPLFLWILVPTALLHWGCLLDCPYTLCSKDRRSCN